MPAKICGNPADGKLLGSSQCKPFPALVPYWPNCAILACQGVTVPRELLACTLLPLVVSMGTVVPALLLFLSCLKRL